MFDLLTKMSEFNGQEFTLEDEDCSEMFITQTPKDNLVQMLDKTESDEEDLFAMLDMEVRELSGHIACAQPQYSDISDDDIEAFEPSPAEISRSV